jgi:hypothetical protein
LAFIVNSFLLDLGSRLFGASLSENPRAKKKKKAVATRGRDPSRNHEAVDSFLTIHHPASLADDEDE